MLELLHQVVHLAEPSISDGDFESVPTPGRTGADRYLRDQQVAIIVLDTNPRADLIAGDLRLTVESATRDCVPNGPAHYCMFMILLAEQMTPPVMHDCRRSDRGCRGGRRSACRRTCARARRGRSATATASRGRDRRRRGRGRSCRTNLVTVAVSKDTIEPVAVAECVPRPVAKASATGVVSVSATDAEVS